MNSFDLLDLFSVTITSDFVIHIQKMLEGPGFDDETDPVKLLINVKRW